MKICGVAQILSLSQKDLIIRMLRITVKGGRVSDVVCTRPIPPLAAHAQRFCGDSALGGANCEWVFPDDWVGVQRCTPVTSVETESTVNVQKGYPSCATLALTAVCHAFPLRWRTKNSSESPKSSYTEHTESICAST
jgi:hypothetical protein